MLVHQLRTPGLVGRLGCFFHTESTPLCHRLIHNFWVYLLIGKPAAEAMNNLYREVLAISRARYGYCYSHPYADFARRSGPPKSEAADDWLSSAQRWEFHDREGRRSTRVGTLLLRDVYQRNYLSAAHLDMPFGRTAMTLREWIEDEPAERGELRPYTELLTEWTPPHERIPEIREALFRAGRLHYHRFFKELDYDRVLAGRGRTVHVRDYEARRRLPPGRHAFAPERFYRPDIFAPWESPEPIPEMFRAEWWRAQGSSSTP